MKETCENFSQYFPSKVYVKQKCISAEGIQSTYTQITRNIYIREHIDAILFDLNMTLALSNCDLHHEMTLTYKHSEVN